MRSYTLPQPRFRTVNIRVPAAPHDAAWIEGRAMKLVGWMATVLVACVLVWLSATVEAAWARVLGGLLLAGAGLLAGMRFSSGSASAYITDLQRLNKVLGEQQRELEEVNAILLKQLNEETPPISLSEAVAQSERV